MKTTVLLNCFANYRVTSRNQTWLSISGIWEFWVLPTHFSRLFAIYRVRSSSLCSFLPQAELFGTVNISALVQLNTAQLSTSVGQHSDFHNPHWTSYYPHMPPTFAGMCAEFSSTTEKLTLLEFGTDQGCIMSPCSASRIRIPAFGRSL